MPSTFFATIRFLEGEKSKRIVLTSAIRDYNKKHVDDFDPKEIVDVQWQESESSSFDGYFKARVLMLAASLPELKAKTTKVKSRLPTNFNEMLKVYGTTALNISRPKRTKTILKEKAPPKSVLQAVKKDRTSRIEKTIAAVQSNMPFPVEKGSKKDEGTEIDLPASEENVDDVGDKESLVKDDDKDPELDEETALTNKTTDASDDLNSHKRNLLERVLSDNEFDDDSSTASFGQILKTNAFLEKRSATLEMQVEDLREQLKKMEDRLEKEKAFSKYVNLCYKKSQCKEETLKAKLSTCAQILHTVKCDVNKAIEALEIDVNCVASSSPTAKKTLDFSTPLKKDTNFGIVHQKSPSSGRLPSLPDDLCFSHEDSDHEDGPDAKKRRLNSCPESTPQKQKSTPQKQKSSPLKLETPQKVEEPSSTKKKQQSPNVKQTSPSSRKTPPSSGKKGTEGSKMKEVTPYMREICDKVKKDITGEAKLPVDDKGRVQISDCVVLNKDKWYKTVRVQKKGSLFIKKLGHAVYGHDGLKERTVTLPGKKFKSKKIATPKKVETMTACYLARLELENPGVSGLDKRAIEETTKHLSDKMQDEARIKNSSAKDDTTADD